MALDYISMRVPVAEAEDDFVVGRGATADGCQRVAQEYLCHCLKVFRKYSYVSVMYRLCIGYVSVILYAGCGKDGTKIRQNFGIHKNSPTLAKSKSGESRRR